MMKFKYFAYSLALTLTLSILAFGLGFCVGFFPRTCLGIAIGCCLILFGLELAESKL